MLKNRTSQSHFTAVVPKKPERNGDDGTQHILYHMWLDTVMDRERMNREQELALNKA